MKKSVEVLPISPFEVITGPMKDCAFRVTKTGRNIVSPKVTLTGNKGGRDSNVVKSPAQKWQILSKGQIQYWQNIADQHLFCTR